MSRGSCRGKKPYGRCSLLDFALEPPTARPSLIPRSLAAQKKAEAGCGYVPVTRRSPEGSCFRKTHRLPRKWPVRRMRMVPGVMEDRNFIGCRGRRAMGRAVRLGKRTRNHAFFGRCGARRNTYPVCLLGRLRRKVVARIVLRRRGGLLHLLFLRHPGLCVGCRGVQREPRQKGADDDDDAYTRKQRGGEIYGSGALAIYLRLSGCRGFGKEGEK